jgi:hypothetical protein
MHCGQEDGLTPPGWQQSGERGLKQRNAYNWYRREIKKIGPVDAVFCMGDMIDGKGEASGGIELITADSFEQCEMAITALREIETDNYHMVEGTAYHSGKKDHMEKAIANELDAEFGRRIFPCYSGVQFDMRHKIGSSSVPWGRHTSCAKEYHEALAWHYRRRNTYPKPNVVLRGHVHYHNGSFGLDEDGKYWLAATCPALQTPGTKYGELCCSGIVDFGFLVFKVQGGKFEFEPRSVVLETMKRNPSGPKTRKAKK